MRTIFLLLAALSLGGCATTGGGGDPRDPWEGLNRKTFAFNDALDKAVMKPIAKGYVAVTPEFAREGVNNFYSNIEDIATSLNNFLQGKPKQAMSDAMRVIMNTTLGVFGLWDVATPFGLEKHDEDFGQTLGWWGMAPGPYFVIPFLGPSTAYWTWWGVDKVRTRANLFKAEGVLDDAALDRYTFLRDAWLQRRRNQVFDGSPPREKEEE